MNEDMLIASLELKEFNEKAGAAVIRELHVIEKSLINNPEKLEANAARLNSLCEHIQVTFKKTAAEKLAAKLLTTLIKHKINKLIEHLS